MIMIDNTYIPSTITKTYNGIMCTYTLTGTKPSREAVKKIKSFTKNALFKRIVEKYFDLCRYRQCGYNAILAKLNYISIMDSELNLVEYGFSPEVTRDCELYREFLKYVIHLKGVRKIAIERSDSWEEGFEGIGIR